MSSDTPDPALAELVGERVLTVPGVHDLHPGVMGEIATYLPGRRVAGVRLTQDTCEVHVVLDWAAPVAGTTDAVRAAVRPLVEGPVDVVVEDVAAP
ncbi:hypothetical protein [Serinicoccus sediminis]|uniref:hypothetical protein n=1 Tax=Serinicoccus sediminis TaxID=2306021 RepID=UPI00101EB25E|nr:hypothetical protein [Serinicoccus sediminis]